MRIKRLYFCCLRPKKIQIYSDIPTKKRIFANRKQKYNISKA